LVINSQVPVGTCEKFAALIRREDPSSVFDLVYHPEFLRLGRAVDLFRRPDHIVIGAESAESRSWVGLSSDVCFADGCSTLVISL